MPEKEVLVRCYDKSGTLLTNCSAISFDGDIVLMYGLPLAVLLKTKLAKWVKSVLAGVNSEIRPNPVIGEKIEFMIHEEDSLPAAGMFRQGRKMISAGMWKCPLLESTIGRETRGVKVKSVELDVHKDFFPLFIFLEAPHEKTNAKGDLVKIFNIVDKLSKPSRGQNIIVQFTPFLDPGLINSLSRGIVSRVYGPNDCMFLTDAVTTPCSIGAPIFLADNKSLEINGKGPLIGMTVTVLTGYEITTGLSLLPILWRLLPPAREFNKYPRVAPHLHVRTLIDETVVSISCVNSLSTGIVIDAASGIILTCSHCIPKDTTYIHVFHKGNIYPASLVYQSEIKNWCDLAIIKVSSGSFNTSMEMDENPAQIGERVHAAGFPAFPFMESASAKPFLSVGYITKYNPSSFLAATCFTFPGQSGGPILRNGKLLGMVTSNFNYTHKSSLKGKRHYRLNLALPTSAFAHYVKKFIETKNIEHLKDFESWATKTPNYWSPSLSKM